MAETLSKMVSLGTLAPDFSLPDTISGNIISLSQMKSDKTTVIMFICNHCPFVKHIAGALTALSDDYIPKGISFVAISSNDAVGYPEDSPENMKKNAMFNKYPFPYLYDESQSVARAYGATCTPDFFIFDKNLKLLYRGQLDNSRPGNGIPVTGKDIRSALDSILSGSEPDVNQLPSIGCNIKWK
jgi:thiol-disulfide isomerase/thioredoxin